MPSLLSNIATTTALAFSLTSSVSSAQVPQSQQLRGGGSSTVGGISAYEYEHMLSLRDFQSVLRTSLDDELDLIAASYGGAEYADEMKGECRHCHAKQEHLESSQSNVRRRDVDDTLLPSNEEVWEQLQSHAWTTARLLARDTSSSNADEYGPLTLLSTNTKQVPRPFLVCSTTSHDIYSLFRVEDQKYLHVPTRRAPSNTGDEDQELDDGDSCTIMTTTANWAYKAMRKYKDVIVQPLVDVMKILPGTMDSVSSEAWRVPFIGSQQASSRDVHQDDTSSSSYLLGTSNATTAAEAVQQQHWERTLTIDIAPGLLAHSTENDLLDLVNIIMTDVQEMSEVGWVLRQEISSSADDASSTGSLKASWQEEYLAEHSLQEVPSLTEMFSLTSPATTTASSTSTAAEAQEFIENERIAFYNSALANGLESSHGCASMFSTLLIQPRHRNHGLYTSFDLLLNPKDAPQAQDLESSASNVDCVRSLIVGLSVHPSVMSLESNLPRFHGWNVAI